MKRIRKRVVFFFFIHRVACTRDHIVRRQAFAFLSVFLILFMNQPKKKKKNEKKYSNRKLSWMR